jgi:hypothetical protein
MDDFTVEQPLQSVVTSAAKDELARDLGYLSIRQMMEQTEIVPLPSGLFVYLTTDADGYWVAWSDQPFYDIRRFKSRQAALSELRESVDLILLQS